MSTLTVAGLIALFWEMTDEERKEVNQILQGEGEFPEHVKLNKLAIFYENVIKALPSGKWYLTCDRTQGGVIEAWPAEGMSAPAPIHEAEVWGTTCSGSFPHHDFYPEMNFVGNSVTLNNVTVYWTESLFYVEV